MLIFLILYSIALTDTETKPELVLVLISFASSVLYSIATLFQSYNDLQVLLINFERCYQLGFEIALEPDIF